MDELERTPQDRASRSTLAPDRPNRSRNRYIRPVAAAATASETTADETTTTTAIAFHNNVNVFHYDTEFAPSLLLTQINNDPSGSSSLSQQQQQDEPQATVARNQRYAVVSSSLSQNPPTQLASSNPSNSNNNKRVRLKEEEDDDADKDGDQRDRKRQAVEASPKEDEGEEEEQVLCCICMCVPSPHELATINGCSHQFCYECIRRWAETQNTCCLCKERFTEIARVHNLQDRVSVQQRNQRNDHDAALMAELDLRTDGLFEVGIFIRPLGVSPRRRLGMHPQNAAQVFRPRRHRSVEQQNEEMRLLLSQIRSRRRPSQQQQHFAQPRRHPPPPPPPPPQNDPVFPPPRPGLHNLFGEDINQRHEPVEQNTAVNNPFSHLGGIRLADVRFNPSPVRTPPNNYERVINNEGRHTPLPFLNPERTSRFLSENNAGGAPAVPPPMELQRASNNVWSPPPHISRSNNREYPASTSRLSSQNTAGRQRDASRRSLPSSRSTNVPLPRSGNRQNNDESSSSLTPEAIRDAINLGLFQTGPSHTRPSHGRRHRSAQAAERRRNRDRQSGSSTPNIRQSLGPNAEYSLSPQQIGAQQELLRLRRNIAQQELLRLRRNPFLLEDPFLDLEAHGGAPAISRVGAENGATANPFQGHEHHPYATGGSHSHSGYQDTSETTILNNQQRVRFTNVPAFQPVQPRSDALNTESNAHPTERRDEFRDSSFLEMRQDE